MKRALAHRARLVLPRCGRGRPPGRTTATSWTPSGCWMIRPTRSARSQYPDATDYDVARRDRLHDGRSRTPEHDRLVDRPRGRDGPGGACTPAYRCWASALVARSSRRRWAVRSGGWTCPEFGWHEVDTDLPEIDRPRVRGSNGTTTGSPCPVGATEIARTAVSPQAFRMPVGASERSSIRRSRPRLVDRLDQLWMSQGTALAHGDIDPSVHGRPSPKKRPWATAPGQRCTGRLVSGRRLIPRLDNRAMSRGKPSAPGIQILDNDIWAERVPHSEFAALRAESPVSWFDEPDGNSGFWAITRLDDLVAVHRDHRTFSSQVGGTELEELEKDPEAREARRTMLETDPPEHTRIRKLVSRSFTRRAIAHWESTAKTLVAESIDQALLDHQTDFVETVARRFPIQMISRLLGVPDRDAEQLFHWADARRLPRRP